MPLTLLQGDTLGQKHKHLNKLVQDAVDNKQFNLTKINKDEIDIHNLLQIDTACKTKNVDYIIEVLKCDDMLYVSRAIKHSTWLITEQEYEHVINSEYLYTQLFPHMLTKAINKLLLHIRLHLKDEKRAELFYEYLKKSGSKEAHKWLLICSTPYIENIVQNEPHINFHLFRRLCKRSINFLQYYTKVEGQSSWYSLHAVLFLLRSNTDKFLDTLEDSAIYSLPRFGKRRTKLIMKKCPERILNNFDKYKSDINVSIVAKNIKKEDIKNFLFKYAKNDNMKYFFNNFENLKHFIKNMPAEDRFVFVKTIYIDKKLSDDKMLTSSDESDFLPSVYAKKYQWYQYAPFNVALQELKKLSRAEKSPIERCAILSMLISCAKNDLQNIKTLLQYYYDKHRNEPIKFKLQFVNNLITQTATHNFDKETWNILDNLFHSLDVYIESSNGLQTPLCHKCIILYKVLHSEKIPDVVENKVSFDTYKKFQGNLNEEQRNKMFSYLLNSILDKIQNKTVTNESDLTDAMDLLKNALVLFKDWKKDIKECPSMHDYIQKLIKIKKENSWQADLPSLYHINKSWRRYMFEEAMMLCPNEDVCLNSLKHNPELLTRHSEEVNALKTDDKITLRRLLSKLRVYWPESLAQQWIEDYLKNINKSTGHKALIKGLFVLLPQKQLLNIVKKYVPTEPTISWAEIDYTNLSISKNIGKYLHLARPLISLDVVLWYAIGDYLQYTVPSLEAILYNMSQFESRVYIPKLLDAQVSLQKYGIRLAFVKLKPEEFKPIFSNIWQTTSNYTIRTRLFNYIYDLLCKATEPTDAKELWAIFKVFIENLSPEDNKVIFRNVSNPRSIHNSVQGEVYMKCYTLLTSLPAGAIYECDIKNLLRLAPFIINLLDTDFVADQILSPIEDKISKPQSEFLDIISSYILHGKTEDEQCDRFRRVLLPGFKHIVLFWNTLKDNEFVMKNSFRTLLKNFRWDLKKFLILNKIVVPVKLFTEIKIFIEQKMPMDEIYVTHTTWKLTLEYVKLVAEHKDMLCDLKLDKISRSKYENSSLYLPEEAERIWEQMQLKLSPQLGRIITNQLKEDTDKYFPSIYWLFSRVLNKLFLNLTFKRDMKLETFKYMIMNEDFIPSYLIVIDLIPWHGNQSDKEKCIEIHHILSTHPSLEVHVHYLEAFGNIAELTNFI